MGGQVLSERIPPAAPPNPTMQQTGLRRTGEEGMSEGRKHRANRFRKAVPTLPVRDCVKALRYYCDVLGFKKYFDDAILGVERTMFAGVSRNSCALVLDQHGRQKCHVGINILVDDVDSLWREYRSRGVKILFPPSNQVWGRRVMAVADLDGHQLHFSAPIRKRKAGTR
jgi:uncharacterized glyoxalase superfamily protein PhnB